MPRTARVLSVLAVVAATATPANAAAAVGPKSMLHCLGIVGVDQYWCAATGAALDEIRPGIFAAQGVSLAASSHLVDLYDAANRTGSSYALYGSACDTNADADGSYALPSAWNDRISSFQGFGNCETKLFENGDYTGNTYGPIFATDYVGATLNDEASSLRVY